MHKKLGVSAILTLLATLLLTGTASAARYSGLFLLTTHESGIDLASLAPVGLIIFGIASLGVGVVGYAISQRRSAEH